MRIRCGLPNFAEFHWQDRPRPVDAIWHRFGLRFRASAALAKQS